MTEDVRERLRRVRLYGLLTEAECRRPWLETAELLLEAGTEAIQLREKQLDGGELLKRAKALRRLTERFSALLVINDRPDIAMLSGADGVHVGQDDIPPEEVRCLVGPDVIIGLSTHSAEQAASAEDRGADYIGVGPVFSTGTKGYAVGGGPELVMQLCGATTLPTVAIGGITPARARSVLDAGAQAIAACSALCAVDDPAEAARSFLQAFEAR